MLLVELRIFRIRSSKTSKKKTDRGAKDKINIITDKVKVSDRIAKLNNDSLNRTRSGGFVRIRFTTKTKMIVFLDWQIELQKLAK